MSAKHDMKSFRLTIANGQSSNYVEWTPSTTIPTSLVAMNIFPINQIIGDVVKVQLIHPVYGVIATYAEGTHLTATPVDLAFDRADTLDIPANITIKLIYDAVDSNGREFVFWVRYRQ